MRWSWERGTPGEMHLCPNCLPAYALSTPLENSRLKALQFHAKYKHLFLKGSQSKSMKLSKCYCMGTVPLNVSYVDMGKYYSSHHRLSRDRRVRYKSD